MNKMKGKNLSGNLKNLGILVLVVIGFLIVLANSVYAGSENMNNNDSNVVDNCYNISGIQYCNYYNYTCNYSAILEQNFSNLPNGTCSFYGKTTMNDVVQSEYNYNWNVSDGEGVVEGCYNTSYGRVCVYYNWTCDYSAILTGNFYNLPNGTCSYYGKTTNNGVVQSEYDYSWNVSDGEGVVEGCYNISGIQYCNYYNWTCDYSAILTGKFYDLPNGTCSFYGKTTMNGGVQNEYNYTWNISNGEGAIDGCSNSYLGEYCNYYNWTCDYSTIYSAILEQNFSNLPNGCSYYSKTTNNGVVQSEHNYSGNYKGENYSYYCDNNTTKFDFDNNNITDIFDMVIVLENLSEGGETVYNESLDANNNGRIDLTDVFYLMERIIIC